jgi:hypothetical protein
MTMTKKNLTLMGSAFLSLSWAVSAAAAPLVAAPTQTDLSKLPADISSWDAAWARAKVETVTVTAQPLAIPRPKTTTTSTLKVQAIQDGKWIAFRLRWADDEKNEAGKLGEYSDAVAIQFPVKDGEPPPVFMGAKDNPVHIFHWRAQYQADREQGLRPMKAQYPNMNPDMYPMEFKYEGRLTGLTDEKREAFSHGRAAGNPQSYPKTGVDEIFAEGWGTSAVIQNVEAMGAGQWRNGEWSVIIVRPLKRENGSVLAPGKDAFLGFAVWDGGKQEVGSRKSVTMAWVPLQIADE